MDKIELAVAEEFIVETTEAFELSLPELDMVGGGTSALVIV